VYQKIKTKIKNLKIFNKKSKHKFPCDNCLILATGSCREICNKVEMNEDKIMELFKKHMVCIDCGGNKLLEGPSGGMCQNVKCAKCGHEFNFGPPLFINRIDRGE
jgi:uncharacterized protein YxjI